MKTSQPAADRSRNPPNFCAAAKGSAQITGIHPVAGESALRLESGQLRGQGGLRWMGLLRPA